MPRVKYMTPAEYARSRRRRHLPGGAQSAVHKAIKTGRITITKAGKINPDKADREWIDNSKNDPARGLSRKAYAEHRRALGLPGMSRTSVDKAVKAGRITLNKHGKIDPLSADQEWLRNSRARTAPAHSPIIGGDKDVTTESAPSYDNLKADSTSYSRARAIREEYRAKVEKLKYEQMKGRLVDIEDIRSAVYEKARATRDQLLGISERVCSVVAAEDDPLAIRDYLDTEMRAALASLMEAADSL